MFNVVFLVGPQATPVRLRYRTIEARDDALTGWNNTRIISDDIGQAMVIDPARESVHATLLTSDRSDAEMQLAPHLVQMESNKIIDERKAADPEFKLYVAKVQSAQRMAAMGVQQTPGGGIVLQ